MIGYYVHHHGSGHLHRMRSIARHLRTGLTVLSTLPEPANCPCPWVRLPSDVDDGQVPAHGDVTAHGTLHWAPIGHDGLRARMAAVAAWVATARPSLMVVDVSVEIATFARAMGIPVVVVAMPGDRTDRAHRLAYDLATALIAAWPESARDISWPHTWHRKTLYTGGFSRYDDRPRLPVVSPSARRRVAFLGGCGGVDISRQQIKEAVSATPDWEWDLIGVPGGQWVDDPWPILRQADVIVTHAGQNTVAETAAARRPAIVIPQTRPHHEQRATAQQLRLGGYATVLDTWLDAERWRLLVDDASTRPDRWREWAPGDGATRAAHRIDELASGCGAVAWT
jgi:hypothetical protein